MFDVNSFDRMRVETDDLVVGIACIVHINMSIVVADQ